MIGEEAIAGDRASTQSEAGRARGEGIALSVGELTGAGVGPISFNLQRGEILGLGGLVGSGRSTVLKLLVGAVSAHSGALERDGTVFAVPRTPEQALSHGIVLIPEERRTEGLALQRSVFENSIAGSLARLGKVGLLRRSRARGEVEQAGRWVKLKTVSYDEPVSNLSGGNQQKVLFGRAVMAHPRVLLLDEPTKGVDVGARAEIYAVIERLAAQGVAVILVSSDFEEILRLSDRIIFLRDGQCIGEARNDALSQNDYLTYCYQGVNS